MSREIPEKVTVRRRLHLSHKFRPDWAEDKEPRAAITVDVVSQLADSRGAVLGRGLAVCNPGEMFVEELGYQIALGRALKDAGF